MPSHRHVVREEDLDGTIRLGMARQDDPQRWIGILSRHQQLQPAGILKELPRGAWGSQCRLGRDAEKSECNCKVPPSRRHRYLWGWSPL